MIVDGCFHNQKTTRPKKVLYIFFEIISKNENLVQKPSYYDQFIKSDFQSCLTLSTGYGPKLTFEKYFQKEYEHI